MVLGGEFRQPAPAAADVQQTHAGLEAELFADEFHLQFLCHGKVRRIAEISTRILHRGVQHGSEKIIPEVVVLLGDDTRARLALEIQQKRERHLHQRPQARLDRCFEASVDCPGAHLLDVVAVPPTIHVGLAEAERAVLQDTPVESFVIHLNIARPAAVDFDIRPLEDFGDQSLRAGGLFFTGMDDGDLGGRRAHERLAPWNFETLSRISRSLSSDCSLSQCARTSSSDSIGGSGRSGTMLNISS